MIRDFLTDILWKTLQIIMKKNQCHRWKNDRNVISAILWKLYTGSPWRDIPSKFCPWKTA
ncbi:MAG: transposase, partial [Endozoicomonadaceae bacterium]|nr:transposase [Endozoicomonadaceae bacterium]